MQPGFPKHIWVWTDRGGWRCCRLVRFARDGKRVVVRFCQGGGRWTGIRYVNVADTRPVAEHA